MNKNYDRNKKVLIGDVHSVFLDFISYDNLTLSERLLIEHLWKNVLDNIRYADDLEMTEIRYCKNCKHLGLDGMFGLICDACGDNRNYDCSKYEKDGDV